MTVINAISEPLKYNFFIYALIAIIIISIISSFIGYFVISKGIIQLTSGISNSMLIGYYIASIYNIVGFIGGLVSALIMLIILFTTNALQKNSTDSQIAIIGSFLFSLAIILISKNKNAYINVDNLLFGNVLAINKIELYSLAIIFFIAMILIYKYLKIYSYISFAESVARYSGLNVKKGEIIVYILLSLFIAFLTSLVGIILTLSIIITPIVTAKLYTTKLLSQYIYAIFISLLSSISGLYLSYYIDLPSGPAITLVSFTIFIISLFINKLRLINK